MSISYHYIDVFITMLYDCNVMKLRDLRIKAVLSQEDLGKMASMSAATINRIELGRQKPRFVTIRKLAKALGVEPGEIEF